MKKVINLTILSTIILALAFIPAVPTNAASKVNITYYSNNGYFKAKPNRSKDKITIKSKINKKRGYAPAIKRDGYTFDGWYTKKKGGKKYSASTIITKKQKLYPHWIKKYKINTNYFVPMGLGLPDIESFQKYFGKLTLINKNVEEDVYPGNYICKTHKKDLIYISSWPTSDSDAYFIDYTKCKLKNVINIKKTTSMGMFKKTRCKTVQL